MERRDLLLLAPALLAPAHSAATPVAGRWRSLETTKGGIGAVYDITAGLRATYSSCAIVEMDYRLDDKVLTLGDQRVGIGWHADGGLQFAYGTNQIEDYTRQGKIVDPARPILGEWKGVRVMGGNRLPATLQFRESNKALLVIFLRSAAGQLAPKSTASWSLALPSLPSRRIVHDRAADRLTITLDGGDPHLFARF